jgi:hypothetical protein
VKPIREIRDKIESHNPPPEIADVLEGLAISISKLHDLRKQINTITTNP